MATSALVQTNICANCALSKYLFQRTGPSCTCHRRVFAPGYTWFHFSWPIWPPNSPNLNPVDYRIWGCLQDCVYQKRTRDNNELKQRLIDVWADNHWQGHRWVEKAASGLCPDKRTPFRTSLVNRSFFCQHVYHQIFRFCRFFLGIANVYRCYGNWKLVLDADNDCSDVMLILLCE